MRYLAIILALLLSVSQAWGVVLIQRDAPAYGGEVCRTYTTVSSTTASCTLTSAVPSGSRIVVITVGNNYNYSSESVADDGSNSYSRDVQRQAYSGTYVADIYSAEASTGLSIGDDVTVTYTGPAGGYYKWIWVGYLTDTTSVDTTATASTYNASPSVSGSTTATNTAAIGVIFSSDAARTYTDSNWSVLSMHEGSSTRYVYYVYSDLSSSGTQNPEGTFSSAGVYVGAWVAYD